MNVCSNYGERKINTITTIGLGGLTPKEFLRDYWQKKPLLVRNALPNFKGLLTSNELIDLACQEDVQSRLVIQKKQNWLVKDSQLFIDDFSNLEKKKWSLLVNDVNHFLSSARDLLLKFNFIPYARMDDLMISYAPKGGGIGPHFDSYDVFLIQGEGTKRWQISSQEDDSFIPDIPLKILRNFMPEQGWLLTPGDMLYLPPNWAHNGVAENEGMTYSVGFRAPSHQELTTQFLYYLQDHINIDGRYHDPDLQMPSKPAAISTAMLRQTKTILNKIKWHRVDIENFLGCYLTEPKTHVFFNPPSNPLTQQDFIHHVNHAGLELDLKSQLLCIKNIFFINGERVNTDTNTNHFLKRLANDQKLLNCKRMNSDNHKLFYQWYCHGYITLINGEKQQTR